MEKVTYLIGKQKKIYDNYIKLVVFLHYLKEIVLGKFPVRHFFRFLKRLLYFLSKMKDNKYVKIGKYTKIALYVPAFPSKAFFKATRKVMINSEKMPCITVLLSVTSACRYNCEHCYQKFDIGKDMNIELLCKITKELDEMGVAFFNIEGGEPFLVFERLKRICESIQVGEIWINSTGDGMDLEKLKYLKEIGVKGIMFSLHSDDPNTINKFMQSERAWDNLNKGIAMCHIAGLDVATNTCITRDDYFNGKFESILELAKVLGISIIQLIKPKPSGGWLNSQLDYFSENDLIEIEKKVWNYNNLPAYKDFPYIAAQSVDEKSDMFGCTAGGTDRFYINAKGDVQPCEFLNISFGNINQEDFSLIYTRMRKEFNQPGDTWLCEACSSKIRETIIENNVRAYPLNKELSEEVINNWHRGKIPEFYKKVTEI